MYYRVIGPLECIGKQIDSRDFQLFPRKNVQLSYLNYMNGFVGYLKKRILDYLQPLISQYNMDRL